MIKTKIKKAIALACIVALTATSLGSTFAANIGTASIDGGASSSVVWDDTFPGTATGTVTDVIVTAQVLPTLNMTLSTGSIDLGTLDADTIIVSHKNVLSEYTALKNYPQIT